MKHILLTSISAAAMCMSFGSAQAQMAKDNPCKFLGNITTSYNWAEYCDPQECNGKYVYSNYWDQVTCENATKWGSVHQGWGKFSWDNADRTYNYCKQKGIIFKFHALIWGSQHPKWIESLSVADTKKAIVEWYDEVKKHYPDLTIIDVVNEAIYSGGNYHSPYKETKIIEALGSLAEDRAQRETGVRPSYNCNTNGYPNTNSYQWLAEAFRLARERWPNATLIYNDYNTFQWQKNEFIALVNGIKACGGPIDAAGNQAHDLNDMSGSDFKNALYDIYNKTKLPQYITEYDINKKNDATFETRYKEQFPIMWEADFVPGVTLWGWIYGKTWVNDGGDNGASGLVRNCQDRSAFTWLQQYMKSDKAKNARAFVCGKAAGGASLIAKAESDAIALGDSVLFTAEVSNASHIKFETGGTQIVDKWRLDPCEYYWTPTAEGSYKIDVTAYDKDDYSKVIASTSFTVKVVKVSPYGGKAAEIPGTIQAENYDNGGAGVTFYDKSAGNTCDDFTDFYRKDDVDIKEITGGAALGNCQEGEWLKYTVNVKEDGKYKITLRVGEGNDDGKLSISLGDMVQNVTVDKTGAWGTFDEVELPTVSLKKGEQTMKITIDQDWIDLDWIKFERVIPQGLDNAVKESLEIVPNPASNVIYINGINELKSVEILNLAGSVVLETSESKVNVETLNNGIYLARVTSEEGVYTKKIVIKK